MTGYFTDLPNLRAHFLPDPGYALVEADLARADAQVIAWEAGAPALKDALRNDEDIHSENADLLYGTTLDGRTFRRVREIRPRDMHSNGMSYRDNGKRWVHATNFAGNAHTLASVISLPQAHIAACQQWWLEVKHPQIGELHRKLAFDLASRRSPTIRNAFGFLRQYSGNTSRVTNLLQQALAWIAQSTVAIVTNHCVLQVDCARQVFGQPRCGHCLTCEVPEVRLLLQIHDSVLLGVPTRLLTDALIARLQEAMRVTVPYPDPLIIGCDVKYSLEDWGHMQKWPSPQSPPPSQRHAA